MTEERALTASPYRAIADFSREEKDLIKEQIAVGATDAELRLFLLQCVKTGLDPFTKQVYWIKRRVREGGEWITKGTIQIGIDGLRSMAERMGEYAGQDDIEYGPDMDYGGATVPEFATATVYRRDWDRPVKTTAWFTEYAQTKADGGLTHMWKTMPKLMIGKCAEALALRKLAPQVMGSLYIPEELAQVDSETPREAAGPPVARLPKTSASSDKPPETLSPAGGEEHDTPMEYREGGNRRATAAASGQVSNAPVDPPKCPKHDKTWREGKGGAFYCSAKDDSGPNGYCGERPTKVGSQPEPA